MASLGGYWKLADLLRNMADPSSTMRTTAVVQDVDGDGVVWVVPAGSEEAVPVNGVSVASARSGETVTLEISGGRASILGNASDPAAGTDYVERQVQPVVSKADLAEEDALRARAAADSAQESADAADKAAARAQSSATTANVTANSALNQLSTVEDVVGTLGWIAEHGTYEPTGDGDVADGKTYYERVRTFELTQDVAILLGKEYYALVVEYHLTSDTSVDSGKTYYARSESYAPTADGEVVAGKAYYRMVTTYALTEDETVVAGKTYYELSFDYVRTQDEHVVEGKDYYAYEDDEYVLVENPVDEDIASYYERVDSYAQVASPTDAGIPGYYERTDYYELVEVAGGENPQSLGWYELSVSYAEVAEPSVEDLPTYYEQSSSYELVAEPDVAQIATYYEVTFTTYNVASPEEGSNPSALGLWELTGVDEAVTAYVASHLSLTDSGLYLITDDVGYRLHLASDGWEITDAQGVPVTATFVENGRATTRQGRVDQLHIDMRPDRISFVMPDGVTEAAYITVDEFGNSSFSIANAIVLDQLNIGTWRWLQRSNGNLTLKWIGD